MDGIDLDNGFSQDEDYSNQDDENLNEKYSYEYDYPTLEEESLQAIKQFAIGPTACRLLIIIYE